jgi:hypothetical protein
MGGTFVSNRLTELAACLNGPAGQEFAQALGQAQDAELPLLRVAALSRLPYVCPDDVLDGAGAWLKIERFTGEPAGWAPIGDTPGSGYRGRLCAAWQTWTIAASAAAVEASLRSYGFMNVRVLEDHEGDFWPGDWYSRFRVVIGPFGEGGSGAIPAEIDFSCFIDESLDRPPGAQVEERPQLLRRCGDHLFRPGHTHRRRLHHRLQRDQR